MGDAVRLLMGHRRRGPEGAALAVTVGLAVSTCRSSCGYSPLFWAKDGAHIEGDRRSAINIIGIALYIVIVAGFPVLLDNR